jgi:erythromycin esterase-like protein
MAENIKYLMDGKLRDGDRAVWWAHLGHVGRLVELDAAFAAGTPGVWGNVGSILNAWLGEAYCPIGALTGPGTVLVKPVIDGKIGKWQTVQVPSKGLPHDGLNAIATDAVHKPVILITRRIPFMNLLRPEWTLGATMEELPEANIAISVPGMAMDMVVSFPVSEATHQQQ